MICMSRTVPVPYSEYFLINRLKCLFATAPKDRGPFRTPKEAYLYVADSEEEARAAGWEVLPNSELCAYVRRYKRYEL